MMRNKTTLLILLASIALCVLSIGIMSGVMFLSSPGGNQPPDSIPPTATPIPATVDPYGQESWAIIKCQRIIKDNLFSPSEADFYFEVEAYRINDRTGEWSIAGKLDGVTPAGVKVTQIYTCRMLYNPDNDTWSALSWSLR